MSGIEKLKELLSNATQGPFKLCDPCTRPQRNTCGIVWAADGETTLLPFGDSCSDIKRGPERVLADKKLIAGGLSALPALVRLASAAQGLGQRQAGVTARDQEEADIWTEMYAALAEVEASS